MTSVQNDQDIRVNLGFAVLRRGIFAAGPAAPDEVETGADNPHQGIPTLPLQPEDVGVLRGGPLTGQWPAASCPCCWSYGR